MRYKVGKKTDRAWTTAQTTAASKALMMKNRSGDETRKSDEQNSRQWNLKTQPFAPFNYETLLHSDWGSILVRPRLKLQPITKWEKCVIFCYFSSPYLQSSSFVTINYHIPYIIGYLIILSFFHWSANLLYIYIIDV